MVGRIKVSVVNYLNSTPFIYGIKNSSVAHQTDLEEDIPSVCAQKLIDGEVDLGLVPVAIIPLLKEHFIHTSFCIGAEGPVNSVMLYSEVPLNEIKRVFLDFHSRTSVTLVKVLAKEYWKIQPEFLNADEQFINKIAGQTAAVVIGDRTFSLNGKYKYQYDLAEEWIKFTGLPFVFAAWVSSKPLSSEFINEFNRALRYGLDNIEKVIQNEKSKNKHVVDVEKYLKTNISYDLTTEKRDGLRLFLDKIKAL